MVNRCFSSIIKLLRGCRQGDPVAAYLFILSLEILLRKIDKEGLLAWESKKGVKQLLEGYADDLTIVLKLLEKKTRQNPTLQSHRDPTKIQGNEWAFKKPEKDKHFPIWNNF